MSEANKNLPLIDWLQEKISLCKDYTYITKAMNRKDKYTWYKKELKYYQEILKIIRDKKQA